MIREGRALALALILAPASAAAQQYPGGAPRAGMVEIGGGVTWTRGYDAGSLSATETSNSTTGAPPVTLFTTSSRVAPVAGVHARAGVYLGPRVSIEGDFQFSRPQLRTRLEDDFENAAPVSAVGGVSSYIAGGSVLYHFGNGAVVPFIAGGGGYLRQLDEDNALVVTGNEVHGGAGVKIWFGSGRSRAGLRVDAQASARSTSAGFEQKRRILPVLTAGLVYRF